MSLKSIFILSVIILNGVFHCPETHSKTTVHDCDSHHECVLEEENSCPELIKRALKKKTDLGFDKRLIEDNLLSRDHINYKAKYHGPSQYLLSYNHSTFLSHQVFLI
jgi:hypothetical protein